MFLALRPNAMHVDKPVTFCISGFIPTKGDFSINPDLVILWQKERGRGRYFVELNLFCLQVVVGKAGLTRRHHVQFAITPPAGINDSSTTLLSHVGRQLFY